MGNDFDSYLPELSVRGHAAQEDEFGRTPEEIIRLASENFAREMKAIMSSSAMTRAMADSTNAKKFKRK